MSQKPSRPLFQQALSAVKKSFNNTNQKSTLQQKNKDIIDNDPFDEMSSGQKQRLKQMGVDIKKTKTIKKQSNNPSTKQKQWKHDKFKQSAYRQGKNNQNIASTNKNKNEKWTIIFPTSQDYSKIYQIVKSQKAFIEEINSDHITFSRQTAYNICKSLLNKQNIIFEEQKVNETAPTLTNTQKESIFARLK